jgi:alpha-glucosidase (family GH31 glycosyl hydrolase)
VKMLPVAITVETATRLLAKVWPGDTTFPDFFHPSVDDYWTDQIKAFHNQVALMDFGLYYISCTKNGLVSSVLRT